MNQEQALASLRGVIAAVGGFALGRGWISGDVLTLITGVVGAVFPLAWGIFAHTDSAKMASVESMPEVKAIVVERGANGSVGAAADDPNRGKVIHEGEKTAAERGDNGPAR
jgi:hypothetical protein